MIEIQLEIAGEEVTFFYAMGDGHISMLRMEIVNDETVDASDLLLLNQVCNAIDDNWDNLMLEAQQ